MDTKIDKFRNKEYWDNKWDIFFDQYQQDLRYSYYLRAVLNSNEKKIIEIGAGSFRDTNALNQMGVDCYGIDYSSNAVKLAKEKFPHISEKIFEQDAFNISFPDKTFDLSFNNGFICYISENCDTVKLIKEQARISKYRIITTFHNAHNIQFVEYFNTLKEKENWYQIRFHTMEEITELMSCVAKKIKIIPVGKGKKYYEDDLINIGLSDAEYIRKSFEYHGLNLLESSERLMCIGEL